MTSNEIATYDGPYKTQAVAVRNEHTDGWIAVIQPVAELAAQVANTEFVPKALRNKPDAITAAVLFGRELDMPPMHALSNIHMVEGKPTLAAETMRAMVLAAGHEIGYGEVSGSICEVKGRRAGAKDWTIVRWSIADAQRAGVAKKDVWVKYPRQMLTARATAELCRMIFPDITHNIRATEELEDGGEDLLGGGASAAPPAETTKVSRAKAATTKTRTTAPPPAVTSGPLHGDPIPPPAPVGSAQAVRPTTDAPGSVPGEVVPGAAAEPPPPAEAPSVWKHDHQDGQSYTHLVGEACDLGEEMRQCPHISNGEQCTFRIHEGLHSYEVEAEKALDRFHGAPEGDYTPDEPAAGPVPDAPKPMIEAQRKALIARFKGLGWTDEPDDRESRLRVVSTILDRAEDDQVETFRAAMHTQGGMTYYEAEKVLKVLAPCRSRDDVLEVLVEITRKLAADDGEEPAP